MDSELLRRGCVAAGGTLVIQPVEKYGEPVRIWNFNGCGLIENHSALPSYVADLLVAQVREKGGLGRAMWFAMEQAIPDARWDFMFATPEQRITAALAVLESDDG